MKVWGEKNNDSVYLSSQESSLRFIVSAANTLKTKLKGKLPSTVNFREAF